MMMSEKLCVLWAGTLQGNENDFAQLHAKLYPKLFTYGYRMLLDEDLTDDLLQDVFIKFWEQKQKIGAIKNVEGYFYRASRSSILNHIRQQKHRASKLNLHHFSDVDCSVEELIVGDESENQLKFVVSTALETLPNKQKEIIKLKFFEDMEYIQIAELLGMQYQSVINTVYRATQVLRQDSSLSSVYAF